MPLQILLFTLVRRTNLKQQIESTARNIYYAKFRFSH